MRRASLIILGVLITLLAGASSARAQGAVNPGGFVVGGGSGYTLTPGGLHLVGSTFGTVGGRSTSASYTMAGGIMAGAPTGPAFTISPVTSPYPNNPVTITAQVSSGSGGALGMTLYYRQGADTGGGNVTMTSSNGTTFSGQIPNTDVTVRGLEYYVVAAQYGGITPSTRPNPQPITVTLANYSEVLPDAQYRLIGFPLDISPSDPADVFGDDFGDTSQTQWKLGRWNDALQAYDSYYNVGPIKRGRGYWVIARGGRGVGASGTSTAPDTVVGAQRYTKTVLLPGWNQIANPCAFNVDWTGRYTTATGLDSRLWAWNGSTSSYVEATTLLPFVGYWVNNNGPQMLLLLPYAVAMTKAAVAPPIAATPARTGLWRLGLQLRSGEVTDASTEVGLADGASDGYDDADFGKPPCPPGRFLAVSSLLARDGARTVRLAGDFRAPEAEGWRFPLLVQGNVGTAATLRLTDLPNLPPEYAVALVDLATGQAYDLRAGGELVLPLVPSVEGTRYDLVIGSEAWLRGEVGETTSMPRRTALLPNYPNPFNPSTKLAFELIAPSHARLEIFDVAGRRVAILLDEQTPGGRHVITWDGRDNRGRTQASGAYFCRLTAGGVTQTRPLTMLK
jgi:hypothetical protein